MPRGVKSKGKRGAAAKKGPYAFIVGSVKYLRKFSADAQALILNNISKDLKASAKAGGMPKVRVPRKVKDKTVAETQREIKEAGADSGFAAGASTTENTSGGAKRTQKKQKPPIVYPGKKVSSPSANADLSRIPGVESEETASH